MTDNSLDINQSNFRQTRRSYGITLQEVADKCHMSTSCISNYEQFTGQYTQIRTRDDNANAIKRALQELIDARISEAFPFGIKEERSNDDMDQKPSKVVHHKGYDKAKIAAKLKEYCISKDITSTEFYKMCDISPSTLAPYSIRKNPVLREDIVSKICVAAGLSPYMFDDAKLNTDLNTDVDTTSEKSCRDAELDKLSQEASEANKKADSAIEDILVSVSDVESLNPVSASTTSSSDVEIKDKKYVFQDGNHYEEYIIVKHIKKQITKCEFISAIQNN